MVLVVIGTPVVLVDALATVLFVAAACVGTGILDGCPMALSTERVRAIVAARSCSLASGALCKTTTRYLVNLPTLQTLMAFLLHY